MELKEWAKLQEQLLSAQTSVIRGYLRSVETAADERKASQGKGRSNISIVKDLLLAAQTPLHVSELISRAHEQYSVELDRESVVSALTKKVRKGEVFVRTGPNTYGLKDK